MGFSACGVAKVEAAESEIGYYDRWIAKGYQAGMSYMANHRAIRLHPERLLEGARTIISVALNYYPSQKLPTEAPQIAYYAYGKDYHAVVKERLRQLWKALGEPAEMRCFTDSAPLFERYWAWKAGLGSCGKNVVNQELRIDSPDPANIPGEILTRGLNVMLGYYKNEEATRATIDADGWYHTGDLGVMDRQGHVFIKGRSKNMLLGANGQNIYPEEIEDKIYNLPFVAECLVVQKGEKLEALIYPDPEQTKEMTQEEIEQLMEKNRKEVNPHLPSYAQIASIRIMKEEFEKTPKKSIKRFLYTN